VRKSRISRLASQPEGGGLRRVWGIFGHAHGHPCCATRVVGELRVRRVVERGERHGSAGAMEQRHGAV
jgi:hypothetical protein